MIYLSFVKCYHVSNSGFGTILALRYFEWVKPDLSQQIQEGHSDEVIDISKPFCSAFDLLDTAVNAFHEPGSKAAIKVPQYTSMAVLDHSTFRATGQLALLKFRYALSVVASSFGYQSAIPLPTHSKQRRATIFGGKTTAAIRLGSGLHSSYTFYRPLVLVCHSVIAIRRIFNEK